MPLEDTEQFLVQGLGVIGLIVLLLAAISARSVKGLLGWGIAATALLLLQFLYSQQHSQFYSNGKPNALYWYQIGSLVLAAIYFLIATIRVIRGQLSQARRKPTGGGQAVEGKQPAPEIRQVPRWLPLLFLFVMGIVLASVYGLNTIVFLPAFPAGLPALLPTLSAPINQRFARGLAPLLLIFSYALYILLFAAILRARTWNRLGTVCFVFGCVLLLNISGCNKMLEGYSGIN